MFFLVSSDDDDDEDNDENNDDAYALAEYNNTYTTCGWNFPVAGLTIYNINCKTYPSYSGHTGVDINIGVQNGVSPIVAVTDGTVIVSTALMTYDEKGNATGYRSYGEYIGIIHDEDPSISTYYCHMYPGSRMVNVGDHVSAGQQIGVLGTTGNSGGPHLHFEVRINGSAVNPLPYLAQIANSDETNYTDSDSGDGE